MQGTRHEFLDILTRVTTKYPHLTQLQMDIAWWLVSLIDADPVAVQDVIADKRNRCTRGNRIEPFVTQLIVSNVLVI